MPRKKRTLEAAQPSSQESENVAEKRDLQSKIMTSKKAQSSLSAFFGGGAEQQTQPKEGSTGIVRGQDPPLEDFPDGIADLWSWNINGVNAVIEKGDLMTFMKEKNPMVLCLNETKIGLDSFEKKRLASKIMPGY